MDNPSSDDTARNRWMVIQVVRLAGAMMIVLGIIAAEGKAVDLPDWCGYLLIAAGMFGVFVAPTLLARKWHSPRQ